MNARKRKLQRQLAFAFVHEAERLVQSTPSHDLRFNWHHRVLYLKAATRGAEELTASEPGAAQPREEGDDIEGRSTSGQGPRSK